MLPLIRQAKGRIVTITSGLGMECKIVYLNFWERIPEKKKK